MVSQSSEWSGFKGYLLFGGSESALGGSNDPPLILSLASD